MTTTAASQRRLALTALLLQRPASWSRPLGCHAPALKSFARTFDAIVGTVCELRRSNKTVLKAITSPTARSWSRSSSRGD
jgi:hypothetical protein